MRRQTRSVLAYVYILVRLDRCEHIVARVRALVRHAVEAGDHGLQGGTTRFGSDERRRDLDHTR